MHDYAGPTGERIRNININSSNCMDENNNNNNNNDYDDEECGDGDEMRPWQSEAFRSLLNSAEPHLIPPHQREFLDATSHLFKRLKESIKAILG